MATFMSLPAEIRTEIYDWCMFPQHDYVAVHHCTKPKDLVSTVLKSPIFRLSAKIRMEALIQLFKTKAFEFSDVASMLAFLRWASKYADIISEVKLFTLKKITNDNLVRPPHMIFAGFLAVDATLRLITPIPNLLARSKN